MAHHLAMRGYSILKDVFTFCISPMTQISEVLPWKLNVERKMCDWDQISKWSRQHRKERKGVGSVLFMGWIGLAFFFVRPSSAISNQEVPTQLFKRTEKLVNVLK